jgi:hypothetical protein
MASIASYIITHHPCVCSGSAMAYRCSAGSLLNLAGGSFRRGDCGTVRESAESRRSFDAWQKRSGPSWGELRPQGITLCNVAGTVRKPTTLIKPGRNISFPSQWPNSASASIASAPSWLPMR